MTIWVVPRKGAYNGPFYDAAQAKGVNTIECDLSFDWALHKTSKRDVLHLHWPSYRYLRSGSTFAIVFAFFKFCMLLALLRAKGVKLWWTAHNLMPHEPCRIKWIDRFARHWVIALSETIFVHGDGAKKVLEKRFPRTMYKTTCIPHGHWLDYYGSIHNKAEAKAHLGIAQSQYVYLMFGQLKPYKNIEGLIAAFNALPAGDHCLLIAGRFTDKSYQQKVLNLANSNPKIRLDARFIDDEEVAVYLAASDIMCMPYNEILTSGTAMLAMSYGLPLISINKGYLTDVIVKQSGILIDSISPQALSQAMVEAKAINWQQDEIIQHVLQFTFEDAADVFVQQAKR
jgi:glycosyltransferase involved in cell wall biosynthesis